MKMDFETPRPRFNRELSLLEALKEKQHHRDRYRETRVEAGGWITGHITLMKSTDFIKGMETSRQVLGRKVIKLEPEFSLLQLSYILIKIKKCDLMG